MKLQCPISKILLPVDGSKHSKRALQFAGCLGAAIGKSLSGITLLNVLTGGYLSRHMANIDFRTKLLVDESDVFKKIKQKHINQDITPFLDDSEKLLRKSGIEAPIERLILDGDAANEIIRTADEGRFSAIIMARRGQSGIKGFLLGSITSKVVHTASRQTVYLVGHRILKDKVCPIPKVLIPVDGSSYSMRGIEHAACLAGTLQAISKITMLRVINLALFEERLRGGIDPEEEAKKILEEAKAVFLKAGIPERLIMTKVRIGRPSDEILKETDEEDYNLIVMGRKGRTALKDLIMGAVSSTVLQRCQNPTVAIVNK